MYLGELESLGLSLSLPCIATRLASVSVHDNHNRSLPISVVFLTISQNWVNEYYLLGLEFIAQGTLVQHLATEL
jgi:hypothetical protein